MQIGVIGVNHRSSDLFLRETLAKIFQIEFGIRASQKHGGDYVLISTCNRCELYFSSPNLSYFHSEILKALRKNLFFAFEHVLYSYFQNDCFLHLGRVISGMDSAIFGESEIQRQVKIAYETFRVRKKLNISLHYLFQKGLKIGKEMRTSFLSSNKETQLSHTVYSVLDWMGGETEKMQLLFIGNSDINRKIISYFHFKGCANITLCTRMKNVSTTSQVMVCGWEELNNWTAYDAIVCGTNHDQYILDTSHLARYPLKRKMILFDLSVPRNIDPKLSSHPVICLYNIDQLGNMIQKRKENSQKEISLCENAIQRVVERQIFLYYKRRKGHTKQCENLDFASSFTS